MRISNLRSGRKGEGRKTASFPKASSSARIYFLLLIFFGAAGIIFLKLFILQISAHGYYKALAVNQHSIFQNLVPLRGEIFLTEREALYPAAVNKATKMAYAVPKEIKDPSEAARSVSGALGLDENELRQKFSKSEDMYEVLKHRLEPGEIETLNALKIDGIHLSDERYRYYPAGELASHILGFVGWRNDDFGGRYGAEAYFEDKLKGKDGQLFKNKDNSGRWISTGEKEIIQAQNGQNLVLTIDHVIQYETEKILKSALQKFEAEQGTIIVMEAKTGRILSLANLPNFNPNSFGEVEDMKNFRNLAVSDPYECGSVFKPLTLAAAIDSGKVGPQTTFNDTGNVSEAGYNIKNSDYKAYGIQTMTQVLENSLNTGAIFAERQIGNKNFSDYIKRFGFGQTTGINLPGESAGNIGNLKNLNSDIQFFTASFGQGITVTPIQLISAYNALANGGVLLKPQIVKKIVYSDGREEEVEPQEVKRVITQSAANQISQMLRSVVVNGHGKRADVPGHEIGGKTGTAQVASRDARGYEEGKNIGSFAGYAPIINPEFTILVRIDYPKAVEWAESSAAPVFGELMKFLLEYKNIEPTLEYTRAQVDAFNKTHNLKELFMQKQKEEEKKNKEKEEEEKEKKEEDNKEDN